MATMMRGLQGPQGIPGTAVNTGATGMTGPLGVTGPAGLGGLGYHGSFYSNQLQLNTNSPNTNLVSFNNEYTALLVNVANNTQVTVLNEGTYNIQLRIALLKIRNNKF